MRATNVEVSSPIVECRMPWSGNSSQRFAPNVPIFQQNARANLANFIQYFFGARAFQMKISRIYEGLGDRQDLNLSVLDRDTAQSVGCEEGSKNICFCFKCKRIKGKGKTRYTLSRGLLSLALPLGLSVSWDRQRPTGLSHSILLIMVYNFGHRSSAQQLLSCWPVSSITKVNYLLLYLLVGKAFLV